MKEYVVYLVIAVSGEYEDYRTRPVIGFTEHADAEQFAIWAYEWTELAILHRREIDLEWHDVERWKKRTISPYDSEWDGDDTAYCVREVTCASSGPVRTPYHRKPFRKTKEPS